MQMAFGCCAKNIIDIKFWPIILTYLTHVIASGPSGVYLWGPHPPTRSLKGHQEKKKRGTERERKEKKKEKDKWTWRIGPHSSTSRGSREENLRGAKLTVAVGGGWGHHSSTLLQGAKINDSLPPPVCDLLDTPLPMVYFVNQGNHWGHFM